MKFTRTSPVSLAFISWLELDVSSTDEDTVVMWLCTLVFALAAPPQPKCAPATVVFLL